jgi:excisionase family DNA binding protein
MPIAAFTPAPPPPAGGLPQYYTYGELSAGLKVTIATVRAWVKAKRLPHPIRIGRSLRFDAAAVREALAKLGQEGDDHAA